LTAENPLAAEIFVPLTSVLYAPVVSKLV